MRYMEHLIVATKWVIISFPPLILIHYSFYMLGLKCVGFDKSLQHQIKEELKMWKP